MSIRDRLKASLARSELGETLARAADTSVSVSVARVLGKPISGADKGSGGASSWVEASVSYTTIRSTERSLDTVTTTSAVVRAMRTFGQWGRASFLYRWLTTEPDPSVVVIDLRETWTVGPVLALLDRLVASFAPSVRRSSLLEWLRDARAAVVAAPVRVASLVVLVATAVDLVLTLILAGFDPGGTALRILVLGIAAVGTQVTLSWSELGETRLGRLVTAALAPPDVEPSDRDDAGSETERD